MIAQQGLVARLLVGVRMVTDARVVHVEIGVHEAGFLAGAEAEPLGQSRPQRRWIPAGEDLVELTHGNLDEVHFTGDEGVPAGRVLRDEFDLYAVGEGRCAIGQRLQPEVRLTGGIVPLGFEAERFPAKARITIEDRPGTVE